MTKLSTSSFSPSGSYSSIPEADDFEINPTTTKSNRRSNILFRCVYVVLVIIVLYLFYEACVRESHYITETSKDDIIWSSQALPLSVTGIS
jgi:hypothetical protein